MLSIIKERVYVLYGVIKCNGSSWNNWNFLLFLAKVSSVVLKLMVRASSCLKYYKCRKQIKGKIIEKEKSLTQMIHKGLFKKNGKGKR